MAYGKLVNIPDARIMFRNFRGEERQYNAAGDRNFNLVLDQAQYEWLTSEGFRVRVRPAKDADSDPQYLLPVAVNYGNRPPKVMLITSKNKILLTEETVGELDYAEIEHLDVVLSPYAWTMPNGTNGVKAYLHSLYATLLEDDFSSKYDDIPYADQ